MNFTRVNLVLGILLVIAAALAFTMNVDYTEPNVEFMPEMKRSAAAHTYAANAVLPDGRTLQAPVQGTIPREDLPLYYAATKEDAVRAGEELQNPFALEDMEGVSPGAGEVERQTDSEKNTTATDQNQSTQAAQREAGARARRDASIRRGTQIYGVFCVSCHGPSGAGDGPVAKRGFPPPPPLTTGKSLQMKDGQLFHILTYGQGSMSPMAAQLSRERRWDAINYIRSLQQGGGENQQQAATNSDGAPDATPKTSTPSISEEGQP